MDEVGEARFRDEVCEVEIELKTRRGWEVHVTRNVWAECKMRLEEKRGKAQADDKATQRKENKLRVACGWYGLLLREICAGYHKDKLMVKNSRLQHFPTR